MASLVTYGGGLRRIDFSIEPNGKRRMIRLGRMKAKAARTFLAHVETIICDRLVNRPHDSETAAWLGGLDETMVARLRAAGLAECVGLSQVTLGAFLERVFAALPGKPATRTFYGHTRRNLEEYFAAGRLLRDITAADADGWRTWLVKHEGLSPATVGRRVVAARTLWRKAVRWKLAAENPFEGVSGGHQTNESRKQFIPAEAVDKLMEAAPDAEWRTIIALARWGGIRTPSETFALRWQDIDWERGTIRVTCPKLAHREAFATRILPLFPELRGPLLTLFEEAEEGGSEYVIARHRLGSANLRTQLERLIARAGLKPWPRLFQNLRASRESELMREYDLSTVCRWIGNSPTVAARHYATSVDLDADFRRAAGMEPGEAQQKAQQTAIAHTKQEETSGTRPTAEDTENTPWQPLAQADKEVLWAARDSNP